MLRLAILFFIMALLAAFLGFGGVASYSWVGAKILFAIFLLLAVSCLTWAARFPSSKTTKKDFRAP